MTADQRQMIEIYLIAGLGLLAIQLGAFAIVSPQLAHNTDDWHYLMYVRHLIDQKDFFFNVSDRRFVVWNLALANVIAPDRFQAMFYIHVFFSYLTSMGFFHVIRVFLKGHAWFAFVCAALYLVYIPVNGSHVMSWLASSSWVFFLCFTALSLYIGFVYRVGRQAWTMLLCGAVLAYMASRANESIAAFMAFVPLLMTYLTRQVTRREIIAGGIWWIAAGTASLEILIPLISGESSYQATIQETASQETNLLSSWVEFQKNAFPIKLIFQTDFDYLFPALFIALAFLVTTLLFWRRYPEQCRLVHGKVYPVLMGLGVVLVTLGGSGYIYAGWSYKVRGQEGAAFGAALVVVAVLGVLALTIQRVFRIRAEWSLAAVLLVFFVTAGQWFYIAQVNAAKSPPFDVKAILVQNILSLVPDTENALILLEGCQKTPYVPFHAGAYSVGYGSYVYDYTRGSNTQIGILELQKFNQEGVNFPGYRFHKLLDIGTQQYDYDQLIILRCEQDRMSIVEKFPGEYAPLDANTDTYNPYGLIKNAFIPEHRARLVFR